MRTLLRRAYHRWLAPLIHNRCVADMLASTDDYSHVRWQGRVLWQSPLDLWRMQETVFELRPRLIIETGTNEGGTSTYLAHLLDMLGAGRVITMDIKDVGALDHSRVEFLRGSSTDGGVLARLRAEVQAAAGPVLVLLDSDHSAQYVLDEMEAYAPFVTPGSWMLVQNGIIDVLSSLRRLRPGPLPSIRDFVKRHAEFEVDEERCRRYLLTHHPMGWLKRL